jgi:hypothetical protein
MACLRVEEGGITALRQFSSGRKREVTSFNDNKPSAVAGLRSPANTGQTG